MLGKRAVRRSDGLGDGSGLSAKFSAEIHEQATELVLPIPSWTDPPESVVGRSLLQEGIVGSAEFPRQQGGLAELGAKRALHHRYLHQVPIGTPRRPVLPGKALRGIRVGMAADGHEPRRVMGELRRLVAMLHVLPTTAFEDERPAELVREESRRTLGFEESDDHARI